MKTKGILISSQGYQAGKTTFSDYLADQYKFCKISFATPLKSMANIIVFNLGYNVSDYIENKEAVIPNINITYRLLLQTLGTEWGRNLIDNDLWVKIANRKIKTAKEHGVYRFVIDDWRFNNETRVDIDSIVKIRLIGKGILDNHQSESQNLSPNYVFKNSGTLQELYDFADVIASKIL